MLTAGVSAGTVLTLVLEFSSWMAVSVKKRQRKRVFDTEGLACFPLSSCNLPVVEGFLGSVSLAGPLLCLAPLLCEIRESS